MEFDVTLQNNISMTVEAGNTGEALSIISARIAAGEIVDLDPEQPQNVVIQPKLNNSPATNTAN